MLFRVLIGVHNEGGITYGKKESAGDTVDSKSDLSKHNTPGDIKFARISGEGQTVLDITPEPSEDEDGNPNFNSMTVSQLKAFAEENDIDLPSGGTKPELLNTVKEAWGDI